MKVRQAKLAQALRGETSNIIDDKKYTLEFDKGMLHAKLKNNTKGIGPFVVFPANIAFLEYYDEGAGHGSQSEDVTVKSEKKSKK